MIPFPCRPDKKSLGIPDEARPCGCRTCVGPVGETCVFCGCFPEAVIRETFAAQAKHMQRATKKRMELPTTKRRPHKRQLVELNNVARARGDQLRSAAVRRVAIA